MKLHAVIAGLPSFILAVLVGLKSAPAQVSGMSQFGIVPTGSYQSYHIDTMNMQNGNAVIQIPLFSLPQRGKLSLSFGISVNSTDWEAEKSCDDGTGNCTVEYVNAAPSYPRVASTFAIAGFPKGGADGFGPVIVANTPPWVQWSRYNQPNCASSFCVSSFWNVYAPDGGAHRLYYDSTNVSQLRSTDGSGFLYLSQLANPYDWTAATMTPQTNPVLIDSHGVKTTFPIFDPRLNTDLNVPQPDPLNITQTDPDNNTISSITTSALTNYAWARGTQYTDTVGRIVPAIPPPNQSTQGCPNLGQTLQPATGSSTWTVPGPNSQSASYLICFATIKYHTAFFGGAPRLSDCSGTTDGSICTFYDEAIGTATVIQSVVLPDGHLYWGFLYDAADPNDDSSFAYGSLTKVITPEGGSIAYGYGSYTPRCDSSYASQRVTSRTVDDGNGNKYVWTYSDGLTTDPNGNDTVYQFTPLSWRANDLCGAIETGHSQYQGSKSTGTKLRTIATQYVETPEPAPIDDGPAGIAVGIGNALPYTVTTTLDNGISTVTTNHYTGSFSSNAPTCAVYWNNQANAWQCDLITQSTTALSLSIPKDSSIADYSGGVLQMTSKSYWWETNPAYFSSNLLDTVSTESIYDGEAIPNVVSQTTTNYDETAYLCGSAAGGAFGHPTTIDRWNNLGSDVQTHIVWTCNGMTDRTIDGKGNTSAQYAYDSTGIFPSSIKNALDQNTTYTWDTNIGKPISIKDPNDISTQYSYDALGRLLRIKNATGMAEEAWTSYSYPDVRTVTAKQDQVAKGDQTLISSTTSDGLGRIIGQVGPDGSQVDRTYDGLDQIISLSNPYLLKTDPTYGVTTSTYDALGRKLLQCQPDNGTAATAACTEGTSFLKWIYNGSTVKFQDEAGVQFRQTNDALGSLVLAEELGTSSKPLSLQTSYTYDTPGNLTQVQQSGDSSANEVPRIRTFAYDSLSRLITSTNPETGTVYYGYWNKAYPIGHPRPPVFVSGYDPNGNLLYKTDARGVRTSYLYDALNRLTSKTYSDLATNNGTPSSCYQYDTASGSSISNAIGRLTGEWTQSGACPTTAQTLPVATALTWRNITSYDPMGRIKSEQQCSVAPCALADINKLGTTYNLAGAVTSSSNGVSNQRSPQIGFIYSADAAGRLDSITSTWEDATHPAKIFQAKEYGPFALKEANLGVFDTQSVLLDEKMTYDSRERITGITATAQQIATTGTPTTTTANLVVNPVSIGDSFTVTSHVSCGSACGSITYSVDGTAYETTSLDSSGNASILIGLGLTVGQHPIDVNYLGNSSLAASSAQVTVTIAPSSLPVPTLTATLSTSPVLVGTSPSVITLLGCLSACGTVNYYLDNQFFQTVTVNADGTVNAPTISSTLAAGSHYLVVHYGGSAIFSPATTTIQFTESTNLPTISASLDVNPVPEGETPRIHAQIGCTSCGQLSFAVDHVTFQSSIIDANGSADTVLAPLPTRGWHILTVSYAGNATYSAVSSSFSFQVIPNTLSTPTLLAALPSTYVVLGASPGVMTLLSCGSACGYVQFSIDGTQFQSVAVQSDGSVPSAPIPSNLIIGSHALIVSYGGNAQYAPASATVLFNVVSTPPPALTAHLDVNPVPEGEDPRMVAQIACSSCGSIEWAVDGAIFQGGAIAADGISANLLIPLPPVGAHFLTASFPGNGTLPPADFTFPFTVIPNTLPVPRLLAALPNNYVLVGTTPNVMTFLSCGYDCGWVRWSIDGQVFQGGEISWDGSIWNPPIPSNIPLGSHALVVKYEGNAQYSPTTATILFNVVSTAPTPVTAYLDLNPIPAGETPWMRGQVGCGSCGMLQWGVDGVVFQGGTIGADGSAANALDPLPAVGTHLLTAFYLGDSTHPLSTYTFPFSVIPNTLPVPTLTVSLATTPVIFGTATRIITALGCGYDCGAVSWYMDDQKFQRGEVGWDGSVGYLDFPSIAADIPIGTHVLKARYEGNAQYAPATSTMQFDVVAGQ